MTDSSKYYILYDGDCGFCNFWVQEILKRDRKDQFLFASLQSNFGQRFLKERGLETASFNTLYLFKPNSFYLVKSQAVLKIAKILGGIYSIIAGINFIPRFLTDFIYDVISKNRMKMASQKCFLPTAEERKKFVKD